MPEVPIEYFGWGFVILAAVLSVAHKVMQVTGWGPERLTRIAPSPLVVDKLKQPATREELLKLERDVDVKFEGIARRIAAMGEESDRRSVSLHKRVDGVLSVCAETKGQVGKIGDDVRLLVEKAINNNL